VLKRWMYCCPKTHGDGSRIGERLAKMDATDAQGTASSCRVQ
jgi:hypothetical protein